jgi:hypothetical protein
MSSVGLLIFQRLWRFQWQMWLTSVRHMIRSLKAVVSTSVCSSTTGAMQLKLLTDSHLDKTSAAMDQSVYN